MAKRRYWSLKKGDRIRLKVRTISGWIGLATVTHDQHGWDRDDDLVNYIRDGKPHDINCFALRREVAKLRDQAR